MTATMRGDHLIVGGFLDAFEREAFDVFLFVHVLRGRFLIVEKHDIVGRIARGRTGAEAVVIERRMHG